VHQVDEASVHFVPLPDNLQSSPAVAALDPRVDPDVDVTMEMATPEPGVVQAPAPAPFAVDGRDGDHSDAADAGPGPDPAGAAPGDEPALTPPAPRPAGACRGPSPRRCVGPRCDAYRLGV